MKLLASVAVLASFGLAFALISNGMSVRLALGNPLERAGPSTAAPEPTDPPSTQEKSPMTESSPSKSRQTLILAGGCFWCIEAVFEEVDGVEDVVSGYIGGAVDRPSYEQVCSGATGHAEACRIAFDPEKVRYEKLLEIFFRTHDPTTLNRQGADEGTQYRSAIFVQSDEERAKVEDIIKKLDASGAFRDPIVTTVEDAGEFYVAEDYHQDYFRKNPTNAYCRAVIPPKLEKLKKVFADDLKSDKND
jgi:peptide-methionine (S)-S-oxide reductase